MSEVNYVSVSFKGSYYMCVEGSARAECLMRANRAWTMGYDDLADELLGQALQSDGCAFEHREAQTTAPAPHMPPVFPDVLPPL